MDKEAKKEFINQAKQLGKEVRKTWIEEGFDFNDESIDVGEEIGEWFSNYTQYDSWVNVLEEAKEIVGLKEENLNEEELDKRNWDFQDLMEKYEEALFESIDE